MDEALKLLTTRIAREQHPDAYAEAEEQIMWLYRTHGILYRPMWAQVTVGGAALEVICSLETPREGLCDVAAMTIPLARMH